MFKTVTLLLTRVSKDSEAPQTHHRLAVGALPAPADDVTPSHHSVFQLKLRFEFGF